MVHSGSSAHVVQRWIRTTHFPVYTWIAILGGVILPVVLVGILLTL